MLERAGWEVTMADSSARALNLFQPGIFDLVLMSLRLPDLSGTETAALFREREKEVGTTHIPIIAHGHRDDAPHQKAKAAAGFNDFLAHPIRQVELMKMLNRHAPEQPGSRRKSEELPPEGLTCIG
jgi:two-component system secretion sensor histidine kinase SsrA